MVIAFDFEKAVIVEANGSIRSAMLWEINIDWRYDWRSQVWVDVGPYSEDDYGGPEEEATDDGSAEVPGRLPDADGADGGDPSDGEDGTAGRVDPGEEGGETA